MEFHSGSSGFYKAPATKAAIGLVAISSLALQINSLGRYLPSLRCDYEAVFSHNEFWRLLSGKVLCDNSPSIICSLMLIYYLRIIERRFGSRKFLDLVVKCASLTVVLELAAVFWIRRSSQYAIGLSTGPYPLIFPLLVPYYFAVPRLITYPFLGIPLSAKLIVYLLAFQLMALHPNNVVVSLCGIAVALLYRANVLHMQEMMLVPRSLARWFDEPERPQQEGTQPDTPSAAVEVSAENIRLLQDMGFESERAARALRLANNDVQRAAAMLIQENE